MRKVISGLCMIAALAGCSDRTEPADPQPMRPRASAPMAAIAGPGVLPAPAGFPPACRQYLERVAACADTQVDAMAEVIRRGARQTQSGWTDMRGDAAELARSCAASLAAFTVQAHVLAC